MIEFIFGVAVGALVGWSVPQPVWVSNVITAVKAKIAEWRSE